MAKRTREKAGIVLRKEPRGVAPTSAFDAEMLDGFPIGTEFDLIPRTRRSMPQHRTYWKALNTIVKATGRWPSAEHVG